VQDAAIAQVLERAVEAGEASVKRGPELLPVLREAGVVDAGAAGLAQLARGALAGLAGEDATAAGAALAAAPAVEPRHGERSRYRYCTTLLVEGGDVDRARLERELAALGDSLLVVGEAPQVKVHVHTDEPGRVLSLAAGSGELDGIEIANMHRQSAERDRRLARPALELVASAPAPATALVVVAAGAGNAALFRAEGGARVVEGGQSMNPSTGDILEAILAAGAPSALVLPNNPNVVLAAERAAEQATGEGVRAAVVPTRSIAAGLAVTVAFDPAADLEINVAELERLLESVRSGELVRAVRPATLDGVAVSAGDFIGLCDGRLVAAGPDARDVATRLLDVLLDAGPGGEVVTLLRGETDAFGVEEWADAQRRARPQLDIELHDGGQPHYPLLIAVE
jgi:DAK2 domain fusion protein YloV